ncbi:MAG: Uncharacterised protein [Gammaproteobacteria bacterium]|nr:MAG: Uncharacterised protein [Gammaproteobacteria bacterium]
MMLNKVYKFVIIFVSIILIVGGYLVFFFDPDNFKTEIEEYVSSKINYTFVYDGKIDIGIYSPKTNANGDENDISNLESKAFISISGIRIFDEVSKPASRIANIGSLGLVVNKDKLVEKIIDVDRAEAQDVVYFGTNVDEILMKTYSLLKFKNFGGINSDNNTVINKIYSNAIIINNKMLINDLYFETQLIQSSGSGTINLTNKRIKIDMIGEIRKINDMRSSNNVYIDNYPKELAGKELPILIRGTLDNPDITIDMKDIIKKELIDPIKDKLIEKIQDELKEKFELPF